MDGWEKEGIGYMAAIEVDSLENIPPVMNSRKVPGGSYLTFSISGPMQPAIDYLYQTYLPKSGKRPAYPLEIEVLGDDWRRTGPQCDGQTFLIPVTS